MTFHLLCIMSLSITLIALPLMSSSSIKHETVLARANTYCFSHVCSTSIAIGNSYPPKPVQFKYGYESTRETKSVEMGDQTIIDAEKLRADFLRVLRSRRSAQVPLSTEPAKPVTNCSFQEPYSPPQFSEAMASYSKENIENLKEYLLQEENFYMITEAGEQGRLPVLIISLKEENYKDKKRPAVVFLHGTNQCKEWFRPLLEAYASRGYITIAIDSRYHGERASSNNTYQEALVSSWKRGDTMPFIFDTVWDLIKLADYLTQRKDIDPTRIGITGVSLGGMHAWFGAFADTRYSVIAPIIGVQGFRWAVENDEWQARVDSIKPVFEAARVDMGKSVIDEEVVKKVWDRIAPGLASEFDSPYSIPAIAPPTSPADFKWSRRSSMSSSWFRGSELKSL